MDELEDLDKAVQGVSILAADIAKRGYTDEELSAAILIEAYRATAFIIRNIVALRYQYSDMIDYADKLDSVSNDLYFMTWGTP